MRFVFSKLFYLLFALGLILLSLSWGRPWLRWVALAYDVALVILAIVDGRRSKLPSSVGITREFSGRFAVGAETEVHINIQNSGAHAISLAIKDEYPPQMKLSGLREASLQVDAQSSMALVYGLIPPRRGRFEFGQVAVRFLSRWNLVWSETRVGEAVAVKVYPNMRRAREAELKALGARSLVSSHRKTSWRGEGREFESLRDYVRGDELRHISWSATAGRAGDNAGLLVFGRKIKAFLPPSRGHDHMDAALEALYSVEPEMIEPSYSRAFEFIAANSKRRSLVVLLTDLVDEEGSKELLTSLKLLRPRHLPLVVTIADRDLKAVVQETPSSVRDLV